MQLGLLTAAFPNLTMEEIAKWASDEGFETIEVACWPQEVTSRRYAGVSHINPANLSEKDIVSVKNILDKYNLKISALAYYPNPLDPDDSVSSNAITHIKKTIDAAELLGVDIVGTFVGKDWNKTIDENLDIFGKVWTPVINYAEDKGIKIAIENCPMLFSNDEWPGGKNLATSPKIWKQMWQIIPNENFGLNLDPSHLILQMIDIQRVVREFAPKIFHVHAKDLMIDRDGLYENGVFSLGMGWQVPRIPGLGDVDWAKFIAALYQSGYNSVISVEHEDRNFEATEELVKAGFLIARDNLRQYIH